MSPRARRLVAGLAAGVLVLAVLLLLWWTLDPASAPPSIVGPPGTEPPGEPTTAAVRAAASPAPGALEDESSCGADRAALVQRLEEASRQPVCESELLADGCIAPIPHLKTYPPPGPTAEGVFAHIAGCSESLRRQVAVDCSEWPCVTLVRRSALVDADCVPFQELAAEVGDLAPDPSAEGIDREFVVVRATSGKDIGKYGPVVDQRWEARRHVLARWLSGGPAGAPLAHGHLEQVPCAEVRALTARLAAEPACDVVRWARGCSGGETSEDTAVEPALVRAHIDEARRLVEALERDCPEFRDRPHALECTDLPCILAMDVGEYKWPVDPDFVCGSAVLANADQITLQTHKLQRCDPTVIIPLWDAAALRERAPVVDERYYTSRDFRITESCQAVERVRRGD